MNMRVSRFPILYLSLSRSTYPPSEIPFFVTLSRISFIVAAREFSTRGVPIKKKTIKYYISRFESYHFILILTTYLILAWLVLYTMNSLCPIQEPEPVGTGLPIGTVTPSNFM